MGKGKLAKFADMNTYKNVFQCPYSAVEHDLLPDGRRVPRTPFEMQGHWREQYFHNQNPIVLELGCGKGEYTVGLAKMFPDVNFIGVDIKGARMWTGATQALQEGLDNVAFLRTNIEIIDHFFAPGEVQQLWLTFSDPQMKNPRKRLTSTYFLQRYRRFLVDGGTIHLKTDSNFLFTYTTLMAAHNHLPVELTTTDLYAECSKNSEKSENSERSENSEYSEHSENSHRSPFAEVGSIQTYYESMWLQRGLSIKYMRFQLPHEGTLEEPDVEIPLDDYRSYHRDKRSPKDTAK